MTRKIMINDATKEELVQFGKESLGLQFHQATGIGKVLASIRQAWKPDHIILYNDPDESIDVEVTAERSSSGVKVNASIRALSGGSSKNDPKVRLFLNEAEGAGGQRPAFFSVNNVPMLIPRGEEVEVPYRYYMAMKSAITTVFEQDENTHEINNRDVPAFPFQVIRLPTAEEQKGWTKREHQSQYPPNEAPPMEATV